MGALLARLNAGIRRLETVTGLEWRRASLTFLTGLIVLLMLRAPGLERTMLGGPDRDMLDSAFKLRADQVIGVADPAIFFDIDDHTLIGDPNLANLNAGPPRTTTPRALLADLLEYIRTSPPGSRPVAVLMDVDIATPSPDDAAGIEKLKEVLAAWAADPANPALIIAREAFPPGAVGVPGDVKVLPTSPYDAIVEPAPNIYWGNVKALADQDGIAREFLPFECVRTAKGVAPLYASALLAYGFLTDGGVPKGTPAYRWIEGSKAYCDKTPAQGLSHGERIYWHLSLQTTDRGRVWPELPATWPGFKRCGSEVDTSMFRVLSAGDVQTALSQAGPGEASRGLLCGRLVAIGGTNTAANDFRQTPLNEMSGTVILINAIRGLQLSGGGLRPMALGWQMLALAIVTLCFTFSFGVNRRAQDRYRRLRAQGSVSVARRIGLLGLNPVVVNSLIALAVHLVGIGLMLVCLSFGLWGYLSAPTIAAAIVDTVQEFRRDD